MMISFRFPTQQFLSFAFHWKHTMFHRCVGFFFFFFFFPKFHPTEHHRVRATKIPDYRRFKTYIRARKTATARFVASHAASVRRFTFSRFSVDGFNYGGCLFLAGTWRIQSGQARWAYSLVLSLHTLLAENFGASFSLRNAYPLESFETSTHVSYLFQLFRIKVSPRDL